MKTVNITPSFKVEIDNYNNHQPAYFKQGGYIMTTGVNKGEVAKDRWIKEQKFFVNLQGAIYYGLEQGLIESEEEISVGEGGEMTLHDYIVGLRVYLEETERLLYGCSSD